MATNEEDILRRIQAGRQADILRMAASMPRSPEAYRQRARLMALLEPETGAEVAASMAAGINPLVGLTQDLYDTGAGLATRDPVRTLFGLGGLALTASPFSGRKARQAAEAGLARAGQLDLFRNKPIDDPAAREAVTSGRLRVEDLPERPTEEQMDSALQSIVRGVSDERSGDAFDYVVQRALMSFETPAEAAAAVRRQFPNMSDAEFAERFGSAVDRVAETQKALEAGRGIRSLTREQKFLQAYSPQQQRSIREQGAGLEGTAPVRAEGMYDVETLQQPSSPLRRADLLSEPTEMDLAASKIIQRRAGLTDVDEMSAVRAGDPTDRYEPVEGLLDREELGDLRTERERLEDVYGEIPTGLDFNSIVNEVLDQFPGVTRSEAISAVRNALNASSSDVAISVGRATLEESGENAARFLMSGVDTGAKGQKSRRRRNMLRRTGAEKARNTERLRQEAFERAYSGDPTERFDPLGQYTGAGSRTPKREYRLANPDWRKGLLTIPPNR